MREAYPLTRARAAEIITRFPSIQVAVVGDLMLDRYLIGDIERISPEAPVPVVHVSGRRDAPGGAANVAANVTAAGAHSSLVGVVGDDAAGSALRGALRASGVADARVHTVAGRPTTTKTRVVARGQQVCRVDEETDLAVAGDDLARVAAHALAALGDSAILLLEDYDKGALPPALVTPLIVAARERNVPVIVDPKYRHFFAYSGATVLKPNRRELVAALGAAIDPAAPDAFRAAYRRLGAEHLLVTLGADGMALVGRDEAVRIPGTPRQVYDVSGAGDTVTAWVGMALAAGANIEEAAVLANVAAGIEVGKPGVATVSAEELLATYGAG